jgi:maltokinase
MTFEDTLATWLVKQRWFAGKGRTVHDLAVVADTEIIPGDPGLRHLMVTVSHGATSDCYQLFTGSGTPGSARWAGCRSTTGCTTRR